MAASGKRRLHIAGALEHARTKAEGPTQLLALVAATRAFVAAAERVRRLVEAAQIRQGRAAQTI